MNIEENWGAKSTHLQIPIQASLELTNRCNERCTHCYIDDFSDDASRKLTQEQWFEILDKLREAGIMYLILMGGEAMLSPYFWAILERASDMGFHVSMISNGLKINRPEVAVKLRDHGLSQATVSLYSFDEDIHDIMTSVPGSCKRTKAAIEYLQMAKLDVAINCLLTKKNVDTIFNLYDYAKERDLYLKVDYNVTPKLSGNLDPIRERASSQQLSWYFDQLLKRYPHAAPTPSGETKSSFICNAGKGKCAVTAYGELLACIEIRKPLGHLLESDFKTAWSSEEAKKWRKLKVGDLSGEVDLKLQNFCDHCPGLADHEHGDPLRMTHFSKEVAAIKQKLWETCSK